ncbi:oligoribonuclease [Leucobacter sp. UCD-THU]|uniref:oligoribonuclease n=1 Tax=Leucobacter sp. UCD-THU TaxID=1292023 RepID=UPI00036A9E9A|nr:oligoribonuclease [Leucobacter sp. UCD-THU]
MTKTTMRVNEDRIVGCDIETTGLEKSGDLILEIAMVVLDNDLNELGRFSSVVPQSLHEMMTWLRMSPEVLEMHRASGLVAEVHEARSSRPGEGIAHVEDDAIEFLDEYDALCAPMLGSNVKFDRGFIETHMPFLAQQFHYRDIDVSTVKELARRRAPEVFAGAPVKREEHRALPDIRESVEEYRYYERAGFIVPTTGGAR